MRFLNKMARPRIVYSRYTVRGFFRFDMPCARRRGGNGGYMSHLSTANTENTSKKNALSVVFGVVTALVISFAAFAILAAVMLWGGIGEGMAGPLTIAVSVISILVGAFLTARRIGEKGWLWGCSLRPCVLYHRVHMRAFRHDGVQLLAQDSAHASARRSLRHGRWDTGRERRHEKAAAVA